MNSALLSRLHALSIVAAVAAVLVSPAFAADQVHVRGTVGTVEGSAVTVQDNEGKSFHLTLGDAWRVGGIIPANLTDIKQGTFIGTANVEGSDGNKALEVVVFPEAMRGTGEGNYGWDLKPKSSMTNATVKSEVEGVDGRTLSLSYKGGEKKVVIPPGTPIVTVGAATQEDVKPGAKVFVSGEPTGDGTMLSKGFIAVGKEGAIPPM